MPAPRSQLGNEGHHVQPGNEGHDVQPGNEGHHVQAQRRGARDRDLHLTGRNVKVDLLSEFVGIMSIKEEYNIWIMRVAPAYI